jgi:predicted nucleic acid-binding protein
MGSKIISNSSPIIALSVLGRLHLLWELFDVVYISRAVYDEIVLPDRDKSFGKAEIIQAVQEKKIIVYKVRDQSLVNQLYGKLHRGELETIVGARELNVDFTLLDEISARNMAKTFFLTLIGTIGILSLAKRENKIQLIKPDLDILIANNYRISKKLYELVLKQVGEE